MESSVKDLEKLLDGEPSWDDIRRDARRLLRSTQVSGGEQGAYDASMDKLIKPNRGDFSDEKSLLAEKLKSDQKTIEQDP
jgi:hypothetical protein